jgi:uncharacterized RDD family membrane protein YckC
MSIIQIATPFNIDIEFELAEFHKRLLAYIIDFVLLILYLISTTYIFFGSFKISEASIGFLLLVIFVPMLFYTLLTELWMNGQTLGKKALKIKVVSLDGGEATLGQYLLRWFLRFYEWGFIILTLFYADFSKGLLALILGGITSIIIIAVTPKSQRLGDLAAGTVVVNTRSKLTINDTVFMAVDVENYTAKFPSVMRLSDRDINTIKSVLTQSKKRGNHIISSKVAYRIKEVLKIETNMHDSDFLEKLLEDYNYLATKE